MRPVYIWALAGLVAVASAAGWGGFKLGVVTAEAKTAALHAEIAASERSIGELRLAVEKQNAAVQIAESKAKAAEAAREQAQAHANSLAEFSKGRMDKLERALGGMDSCSDTLEKYWELRQ